MPRVSATIDTFLQEATASAATLTALEAMTAAQQGDSREAIAAQSTSIGFLDRFDYGTRYAENAELVHNTSLPEIGGSTYQLATASAPLPKIVSRAMEHTWLVHNYIYI